MLYQVRFEGGPLDGRRLEMEEPLPSRFYMGTAVGESEVWALYAPHTVGGRRVAVVDGEEFTLRR